MKENIWKSFVLASKITSFRKKKPKQDWNKLGVSKQWQDIWLNIKCKRGQNLSLVKLVLRKALALFVCRRFNGFVILINEMHTFLNIQILFRVTVHSFCVSEGLPAPPESPPGSWGSGGAIVLKCLFYFTIECSLNLIYSPGRHRAHILSFFHWLLWWSHCVRFHRSHKFVPLLGWSVLAPYSQ